ncbi:MAG: Ig-like domain-containing protein, partial [Muribaculaceae bacterium]|nr:Ig-like domain-containing protein [Muribaculaceae bacterium]
MEHLIEHNRMVNVNEEYSNGLSGLVSSYYVINDNLQFKVIADEMKTIYLFANEKAVNLNKSADEEFDFTTDLKVGKPFPTESMESLLIMRKADTAFIDNGTDADKYYIPMSEFFNVKIPATTGKAEDFYYKTLFLTRSLIKFSFSIVFNQGELTEEEWNAIQNVGMKLSGVKITNLANSSYYLPNNTEYKPSKYPDDFTYLKAEAQQINNPDREIISFTVPENAGASDYTFMFKEPIKITKKDTEGNNEVAPAIYLPESKIGEGDNYMVSLIFDDESLNSQYESKPLPLTNIARNTHVKVNMVVNLKRQTMEATVTLFPYTGVNLKPLFGFSVPVTSVHIKTVDIPEEELKEKGVTVAEGQTVSLVGYVLPNDANNKSIKWFSEDENIATVTNEGLVTGVNAGTAGRTTTIKATSVEDTTKYAECTVRVTPKIPVESIEISTLEWTGNMGETVNLIVTVVPEYATNKNIKWFSNDTTVATVSPYGTVTAVDGGSTGKEAIITAASKDNEDIKAICKVFVNKRVPVEDIKIVSSSNNSEVHSLTLTEGGLSSLTAKVEPANATNQNIKWTSSNDKVATVSSYGLVTAISKGTADITATSVDNPDKSATCTVTVNKKTTQVDKVEVSPDNIGSQSDFVPGNTSELTFKVTLTNGTSYTNNNTRTPVTWTSSNPDVASISGRTVTAVSKGEAIITATSDDNPDKSATCKVTVKDKI